MVVGTLDRKEWRSSLENSQLCVVPSSRAVENSAPLGWTGWSMYPYTSEAKKAPHIYARCQSIRIAAWYLRVRRGWGWVNEVSHGYMKENNVYNL